MPASPASTNPEQDAQARHKRLREQMKAFYGSAAANSAHQSKELRSPATSPASSQKAVLASPSTVASAPHSQPACPLPPAMNMDSEFFNVQQYTTHLLQNESLKGLVETDTSLLRSIRKLDGELQELVYRNYAKFISATDAVREMRRSVSAMDQRLGAVHSHVEKVEATSHSVSDALVPHLRLVEETITTNRKLKKAYFIRQLPDLMRELLKAENFSECVKYWVIGDAFFCKHVPSSEPKSTSEPSFLESHQQTCWEVVGELYQKMEDKVSQIPLDDPTAMDKIHSLVESLRLLRSTSVYQSPDKSALASKVMKAGEMESGVSFEESIRRVLMRSVNSSFTSDMEAVGLSLQEVFLHPSCNSCSKMQADEPVCFSSLLENRMASLPLSQRHLPMEQLTVREPLAHLKSACALLTANSSRVQELLLFHQAGAVDSSSSLHQDQAALQAKALMHPALIQLLNPLRHYFTSWIHTYCHVLFWHDHDKTLDRVMQPCSTSAAAEAEEEHDLDEENASTFLHLIHHPSVVEGVVRRFVTSLFRSLRQLSSTLKELGEMYLGSTAGTSQVEDYTSLVNQCILDILGSCATTLSALSCRNPSRSCFLSAYSTSVSHYSASSLLTLLRAAPPPLIEAPISPLNPELCQAEPPNGKEMEALQACLGTGVIEASNQSSGLHFILACFASAALGSHLHEQLGKALLPSHASGTATPIGAGATDTPTLLAAAPVSLITGSYPHSEGDRVLKKLEEATRAVVHRGIILEGQYSAARLESIMLYATGNSNACSIAQDVLHQAFDRHFSSSAKTPRLHPLAIAVVIIEWTALHRVISQLPSISVDSLTARGDSHEHDGRVALPPSSSSHHIGSSVTRNHVKPPSLPPPLPTSVPVRPSTAAKLVVPPPSDFLGGAPKQRTGDGILHVAYERVEIALLQNDIDAIFRQQSFLSDVNPVKGAASSVLRGVIVYVLRRLVDLARNLTISESCSLSFSTIQLHCTFLVNMLLQPECLTGPSAFSEHTSGTDYLRSTSEWANSSYWGSGFPKFVQRELDEVCMCVYEERLKSSQGSAEQNSEKPTADLVIPPAALENSLKEALGVYHNELQRTTRRTASEERVETSKPKEEALH